MTDGDADTIVLFRPVGEKELALIRQLDDRAFPPRLPEQPIFYPVANEATPPRSRATGTPATASAVT